MTVFSELIGGISILAGLYYIGVIISRCTLLSAKRMELEMEEKAVQIKREKLKLLEGEIREMELIAGDEEELVEDVKRIEKEKLKVIVKEGFKPQNRW